MFAVSAVNTWRVFPGSKRELFTPNGSGCFAYKDVDCRRQAHLPRKCKYGLAFPDTGMEGSFRMDVESFFVANTLSVFDIYSFFVFDVKLEVMFFLSLYCLTDYVFGFAGQGSWYFDHELFMPGRRHEQNL